MTLIRRSALHYLARWTEGWAKGMIIRDSKGLRMSNGLIYRLALLIVVGATSATTQTVKSGDPRHPEQPVDRSKALDQFTQSVQSRLPPGAPISVRPKNYIDDYILGKMKRDNVPNAALCTDTEFLRRVSL